MINNLYHLNYAGVDEVGRGCLAGPVTVCSLILKNDSLNHLLNDSKKLSEKKRDYLFHLISDISEYKIISIEVDQIDAINILQATLLGMRTTLETLNPIGAYIDGNQLPATTIPCETIIGGDGIVPQISAASIIAKVTRDRYMKKLAEEYPQYGFESHKGYGTKQHLDAIEKYGITPHHRKSFSPVRQMCLVF